MSIRQRKKHLIKAGFIGGIAVFVPLVIIISFLIFLLYHNNKELEKHRKIEKESATYYSLAKDITADNAITKNDLKKVSVSSKQKPKNILTLNDIIGKRAKLDLSKDTLLTKDLVYEGDKLQADLRLHSYSYIKLEDKINVGDYVDIRISFPNGVDFILISKKKVYDYSIYNSQMETDNSLWLEVSEEEILGLSSAVVDAYQAEGCSIYAILYIEETQDPAIVTYPVNQVVQDLMLQDPNIVNKASNVLTSKLRKELDLESLYSNEGKVNQSENVTFDNIYNEYQTDEGESSFKDEKEDTIEYLD